MGRNIKKNKIACAVRWRSKMKVRRIKWIFIETYEYNGQQRKENLKHRNYVNNNYDFCEINTFVVLFGI